MQDGGLENVSGSLFVRTLTSNINACELLTFYAHYIYAKLFLLVLWLANFSLSKIFHWCCLFFQSWLVTYVLKTMISFTNDPKTPFDSLSSHRLFKYISLYPATNSACFQEGTNAAGHSSLCKWSSVLCSSCSCTLWSWCDKHFALCDQYLQQPDNNLGQLKIVWFLHLLCTSHQKRSAVLVKSMNWLQINLGVTVN